MTNKAIINSIGKNKKNFAEIEQTLIFEMFRNSFESAAVNIGEIKEYKFEIAGQTICLKFAGDALFSPLTKAFSHLASSNKAADLTFFIWDGLTTQQKLPVLVDVLAKCAYQAPWLTERGHRSELYDLSKNGILSSLYGDLVVTSLHFAEKSGVYWASSAKDIPYYEVGAPLRIPLGWYFSSPTRQILHSGAVGTENGGVLLAGKGGSGKSTTALNCLDSPLFYASDDYMLVSLEADAVIGHSLFNTAKVKSNKDLERFKKLDLQVENAEKVLADDEKPMMFLNFQKPEKLIRSLPLKAIVFPRFVAGETAHYSSMTPHNAFKNMINSNFLQMPHFGQDNSKMMAELVKKLPAYQLLFGENQKEIPNLILEILAENK